MTATTATPALFSLLFLSSLSRLALLVAFGYANLLLRISFRLRRCLSAVDCSSCCCVVAVVVLVALVVVVVGSL